MTTTNATTYTTKAYAMGNVSIAAGDTATIVKTYTTKRHAERAGGRA